MHVERFFKKILIYFVGNFSSKILISLLIPIYAIFVSAEDLGVYDYLQTIMNVYIILAFIAVWEAVLRFVLIEEYQNKKVNTDNIICFSCIVAGIVFGLTVIISIYCKLGILNSFFNATMNSLYGIAMVWQYLSRAYEKNMIYVKSGIIGTTINFIAVIIFVCLMKMGLTGLLLSYSLGRLSIVLFIESKLTFFKNFNVSNFKISVMKKILKFSFPLAVNSLAGWMLGGIGSILIINKLGKSTNGLYAFSTKFSSLIISLGSIFVMALMEEVLIEFRKEYNERGFEEMLNTLSRIFIIGSTLILPLIGIFYILISGSDYVNSLNYIPFLICYALFTVIASAMGTLFQVLDKTQYQFITTLIGATVMIVISVCRLSKMTIYDVLIGQVFGAFFMLLSRYIIIKKTISIHLEWIEHIKHLVMYILVSLILVSWKNYIIYGICFLVCISGYYLQYRDEICFLLKKYTIKRK